MLMTAPASTWVSRHILLYVNIRPLSNKMLLKNDLILGDMIRTARLAYARCGLNQMLTD